MSVKYTKFTFAFTFWLRYPAVVCQSAASTTSQYTSVLSALCVIFIFVALRRVRFLFSCINHLLFLCMTFRSCLCWSVTTASCLSHSLFLPAMLGWMAGRQIWLRLRLTLIGSDWGIFVCLRVRLVCVSVCVCMRRIRAPLWNINWAFIALCALPALPDMPYNLFNVGGRGLQLAGLASLNNLPGCYSGVKTIKNGTAWIN